MISKNFIYYLKTQTEYNLAKHILKLIEFDVDRTVCVSLNENRLQIEYLEK